MKLIRFLSLALTFITAIDIGISYFLITYHNFLEVNVFIPNFFIVAIINIVAMIIINISNQWILKTRDSIQQVVITALIFILMMRLTVVVYMVANLITVLPVLT